MQYGFMSDHRTMDTRFILWQMHKKHLGKHNPLYFAFIDLEKYFDRVTMKGILWATWKLDTEKWIITFVQAIYPDDSSSIHKNNTFSKMFVFKAGVHQGSVPSPLLFLTIIDALSQDCRHECPWELPYADDPVIMDVSLHG